VENVLLFIVLLLISSAVWLIDRLGRAAAKAAREEQGPPPLPPSARTRRPPGPADVATSTPVAEPTGTSREGPSPLLPTRHPPPVPLGRMPAPVRLADAARSELGRGASAHARASIPVSRAMREHVRRHDVPRPIDQMRRQTSRGRRVSVARARDGIVLSAVLGPCRGIEPFQGGSEI